MAKKLRDLIQKNVVKAGEYGDGSFDNPGITKSHSKKFADLHRGDRVDDANGNGDELFKASNIKKDKHPRAPVTEENLDELGLPTLASYINKAYKEAPGRRKEIEGIRGALNASLHPKLFMKTLHKDWKRKQGVEKATDKLGGGHPRVYARSNKYRFANENLDEMMVTDIPSTPGHEIGHHRSEANHHLAQSDHAYSMQHTYENKADDAKAIKQSDLHKLYSHLSTQYHDLHNFHIELANLHLKKHLDHTLGK